ncbi:MAG TPA: amidohydrolase family protein, partial [Candidatus Cloacimonadota bacterium]|nr:amidohydrolase family protein [Candidatus Cloacimonadota bacterium]
MQVIALTNARLYDPILGFLQADSLIIKQNRIDWIGDWKDRPDPNHTIDSINLNGKVILPAFIDTHTHFFEYARKKVAIDLEPAMNLTDIANILEQYRNSHPILPKWLRGSGWNRNIYPDSNQMDCHFLDRIFPDIPVSFESKDFHSKWCNSLALKAAGIHADTPNPTGGYIHHFPDGTPNGMLSELAWDLIDRVIPPMTRPEMKQIARSAIEESWKLGLAGIHSMENAEAFSIYNELDDEGIPFRFCWHFPSDKLDEMIASGIHSYTGSETLKIGGMKIFMDGSIGSQTASMFEPYPDQPNYYGHMNMTAPELEQLVEKGVKHGISSSIH